MSNITVCDKCGTCRYFVSTSLISSGTNISLFGICSKVSKDDPGRYVYNTSDCCNEFKEKSENT